MKFADRSKYTKVFVNCYTIQSCHPIKKYLNSHQRQKDKVKDYLKIALQKYTAYLKKSNNICAWEVIRRECSLVEHHQEHYKKEMVSDIFLLEIVIAILEVTWGKS